MTMTYKGGPLDGREANAAGAGEQVRIPIYGRGYDHPATGTLVYAKVGRTLVFVREERS